MYQRHLKWLLSLSLILALLACATTPKGTTQTVYAAGWTLVGATNSVADLHDAGTLKGADYDNAKAILLQAHTAYQSAKLAVKEGRTSDVTTYITLVQTLLNQLAAYLQSKGVK